MPTEDLDRKVWALREAAERFAREPIVKKLGWLYQVRERVARAAERWEVAICEHVRLDPAAPAAGEAWILGPAATLRQLRLLSAALADIQRHGAPVLPGKARRLDNGQLSVRVFPAGLFDHGLLPGVTAEVSLNPSAQSDAPLQASFYREASPPGRVALVLGAGNLTSIPALDTLHKLFVEGQVVVLKLNPVNDYIGPIFEDVMKPLIDQGYLTIVYGGAEVGSQLCLHPQVDEIHITGSDRTHDAIVWGSDKAERERRRQLGQPLLQKRITSELGNITPVVVVPGPYSDTELAALGESIAGMVTQNASFNCVSAKMLVLPRGWTGSEILLGRIGSILAQVPARYAFYPGARERYQVLTRDVERVETFGGDAEGTLPWTLIRDLDAHDSTALHFRMEPFCSILSVVELDESEPGAFLRSATRFCNDTLWGTLNVTLFVPPARLDDPSFGTEVDSAVRQLRYGAVGINQWSAVAYPLGTTPWGGHPSTSLADIQSGQGWVHNSLMLENIEKCVVRGPLTSPFRPLWSPLHRTCHAVGRELCAFEAEPNAWRLSKLGFHALRG
ncbi:MAG TPA: aldehyde dehydrogenase family protein [Polyangiaceae bacterium]|nr:aldehyde dehydrogenase family protein [Polyangiaceae bacterium]